MNIINYIQSLFIKKTSEKTVDLSYASQWQLMSRRFRRHRLAVVSLFVLIFMYLLALFCEFVSPYTPSMRNNRCIQAPPQLIRLYDPKSGLSLPFVYKYKLSIDERTWQRIYTPDKSKRYPVRLFARGERYRMWGFIPSSIHLFGTDQGGYIHLFGTDKLGRDMFSRIIYGARISLTIGLIGVVMTFMLGVLLGGLAGYYGGIIDSFLQRIIEVLQCVPKLPLWMALSAALPGSWTGLKVYFAITIILSLMGWTGLARVVRSKFLSLREEDFVIAAKLIGASRMRIIFRHMLPSFLSHIITAATMAIPGMILGETALSFLGIGLKAPIVSWGVLLQRAQNYQAIALTPWLLIPCLFVIIVVLAFNIMGDGLRDAADPYHN